MWSRWIFRRFADERGYNIVAGYDHWKPAVNSFNHNFGTSSEVTNILDFQKVAAELAAKEQEENLNITMSKGTVMNSITKEYPTILFT